MFKYAITRVPGNDLINGITTSNLGVPDYDLALEQHSQYINILKSLDLEITVLEPLKGFPDACFVEDTAVVTPEIAIITNPGAPSRKGEINSIQEVLSAFKPISRITSPGTVDGGDIFFVDKHFYIGISERTNLEGAKQLEKIMSEFGYSSTFINVAQGLHFKSSVNYVGNGYILATTDFIDIPELSSFKRILVDKDEEYAANSLLINHNLIIPTGFPKTKQKLADVGIPLIELDTSEFQKLDGALTCLSLRF